MKSIGIRSERSDFDFGSLGYATYQQAGCGEKLFHLCGALGITWQSVVLMSEDNCQVGISEIMAIKYFKTVPRMQLALSKCSVQKEKEKARDSDYTLRNSISARTLDTRHYFFFLYHHFFKSEI